MIRLRPYQTELMQDIRAAYRRGIRRVCATMPTGAGKTMTFAEIAHLMWKNGKTVKIIAHREELIDQISRALARAGVDHSVLARGYKCRQMKVQVCSVFTLAKRGNQFNEDVDLLIMDECHHAPAGSWKKVFDLWPRALVLGVTATPVRLDGKGLSECFDELLHGPSVEWLTEHGYLSPAKIFAPPTELHLEDVRITAGDYNKQDLEAVMKGDAVWGSAVKHYRKYADGLPGVAFCVSIAHAEDVARQFNEAGIPAISIDGKLSSEERARRVKGLHSGEYLILTSCELINEGFDCPDIVVAILLRPTKSKAVHLQQIGRALRIKDGKAFAIILDHVGNCERHGLPTDDYSWTLDGTPKGKRKSEIVLPSLTTCLECYAVFHAPVAARVCPMCGVALPKNEKKDESEVLDKELVELQRKASATNLVNYRQMDYKTVLRTAKTEAELKEAARQRGWGARWINNILNSRLETTVKRLSTIAEANNLTDSWVETQLQLQKHFPHEQKPDGTFDLRLVEKLPERAEKVKLSDVLDKLRKHHQAKEIMARHKNKATHEVSQDEREADMFA